jgi:hypothetical protein
MQNDEINPPCDATEFQVIYVSYLEGSNNYILECKATSTLTVQHETLRDLPFRGVHSTSLNTNLTLQLLLMDHSLLCDKASMLLRQQ